MEVDGHLLVWGNSIQFILHYMENESSSVCGSPAEFVLSIITVLSEYSRGCAPTVVGA